VWHVWYLSGVFRVEKETMTILASEVSAPLTPEDAKAHAEAVVTRSKTSFALGMRILPRERREAMYAIYAFCREIDDIADEAGTAEEKHAGLNAWREEIQALYDGNPTFPTAIALDEPVRRFDLNAEEFILLIEGMEMDVDGPIRAPSFDDLLAYCRRAAGAVGMLSMPVFGAPDTEVSDRFALSLADALQLTNIIRDVRDDAAIGRLYLPREMLENPGITSHDPDEVAYHPAAAQVCRELGAVARQRFRDTRAALKELNWRQLRPALLMMGMYERILAKLESQEFKLTDTPVKLSKLEKFAIAARYAIAPPPKA
jgi:phytoene synthase